MPRRRPAAANGPGQAHGIEGSGGAPAPCVSSRRTSPRRLQRVLVPPWRNQKEAQLTGHCRECLRPGTKKGLKNLSSACAVQAPPARREL